LLWHKPSRFLKPGRFVGSKGIKFGIKLGQKTCETASLKKQLPQGYLSPNLHLFRPAPYPLFILIIQIGLAGWRFKYACYFGSQIQG
jgi:hypothetical protein